VIIKYGHVDVYQGGIDIKDFTFNKTESGEPNLENARLAALVWAKKRIESSIEHLEEQIERGKNNA
jgi:hypothetical protein